MARKLKVEYDADASPVQRAMSAMQGNIAAFAGNLSGIQKAAAIGLGAVVVGGAAAGVALFKVGKKFDEAYDTIRVGTGATGKSLEGLQTSFKNVVKDVPTDFGTASTAIADLNTRTGLTGAGLEKMAKQQLELARITKTDVAANIASTTRVFGDWGIATDQQSGALDKMFRASQATGIGVDALASKVVQFGAPLRQMGFSFDQSIGLLAKFEKEGVNSELVMGSMRIALGKLAKSGKDPIKAFQEQVEAIKATGDAGKANALALELFGARAGPDMAAAIREGRFELGDLLNTISNGEETIMGAGEATQDMAEKWQMFKNRVLVALEPLAMRVFGAVGKAFDIIAPKLEGFLALIEKGATALSKADPAALKFIGTIVGLGVAVLGAVLAVNKVIAVFKALQLALMANPFVLVAAAVVALAYLIYKNWDSIRSAIGSAWDWITSKTEGWGEAMKGIVTTVGRAILAVFTLGLSELVMAVARNWDSIKAKTSAVWTVITGFLKGAWDSLKAGATAVWNSITTAITTAVNNARTTLTNVWNGIRSFLTGIWDGIKSAASAAWNFITSAIGNALNQARSTVSNIWNGIKGTVDGVLGGIKSSVSGAWNFVRDTISNAINDARNSVSSAINAIKGYFDGLLAKVRSVVDFINRNMEKLAFWRHSPSVMEQMAKATVQGVNRSWDHLMAPAMSVGAPEVRVGAYRPAAPSPAAGGASRLAGTDVRIENLNVTVQNPADIAPGIARELGWSLQGISRARGGG